MCQLEEKWDLILSKLSFTTSRSSGKGGQHANKTETRVSLIIDINELPFSEELIERIKKKLRSRLSASELQLHSEAYRSQRRNKEEVTARLYDILKEAIKPVKKRKKTEKPKIADEKRLKEKHINAKKKRDRRGPGI